MSMLPRGIKKIESALKRLRKHNITVNVAGNKSEENVGIKKELDEIRNLSSEIDNSKINNVYEWI